MRPLASPSQTGHRRGSGETRPVGWNAASVPLAVTARPVGRVMMVVTVRGEIDMANQDVIQNQLLASIDRPGVRLIVDLTAVDFMGAAALTALLTVEAGMRASDGRGMSIVASTHPVITPLTITGLDKFFDVHPDLAHAITRSSGKAVAAMPSVPSQPSPHASD